MQPLVAGPRSGLTEAQVLAAINSPNPQKRDGVTVLKANLEEADETLPVNWDAGGNVRWSARPRSADASATETTEVRRTATVTVGDVDDGLLLSRLFRVWTELRSTDGTWVRFHLFTGLCSLPGKTDDGRLVSRTLDLLPREHLWRSRALEDYETVTASDVVLDVVRDDLSSVFGITDTAFPQPEGDGTLGEDMTFEVGTSYLEKWTRLFNGVGLDQPITDVDGLPTAQLLSTLAGKGPEWVYGPGEGRVTVPGSVDPLSPEVPNRIRYVARQGPTLPEEGNGFFTVVNQSDGPASIDQRGFVVAVEVTADATNQDELEAFGRADAARRFAGGGLRLNLAVGLNPLHGERDRIRAVRPRLGTSGIWDLTDHTYPLGKVAPNPTMPLVCELKVDVTEEAA